MTKNEFLFLNSPRNRFAFLCRSRGLVYLLEFTIKKTWTICGGTQNLNLFFEKRIQLFAHTKENCSHTHILSQFIDLWYSNESQSSVYLPPIFCWDEDAGEGSKKKHHNTNRMKLRRLLSIYDELLLESSSRLTYSYFSRVYISYFLTIGANTPSLLNLNDEK